MLRAASLSSRARHALHANSMLVKRFASETTPTPIATSAVKTTTTKKGRRIASIVLLTTVAYSGAIYYSFKNEAFRDTFTTYVWGTEDVLDRIEELVKRDDVKQYRDKAIAISETTSQYASKVKEYSVKAKDATTGAYDRVSGTVTKLTGPSPAPDQAEPKKAEVSKVSPVPAIKTTSVETKIVKKPSDPNPVPKQVSVEKTTVVVPVALTQSSESALSELSRTIDELNSILNDAGLAGRAKPFVETARNDLTQLNKRFSTLQTEENAIVGVLAQLQAKTDKLHSAFDAHNNDLTNRFSEQLARQSEQLHDLFAIERRQLQETFIAELVQERLRHATELADALVAQAVEIQRRWIREVRYRVEHERAGRLAKLDNILIRLKALERISLDNAERLDHSSRAHQLWTAVRALTHAIHQPRAFAEELEVLRDVASASRDHAELVGTVVASIDDRVSERGVHSVSDLAARWCIVREEVRRASLVPEDGGFMSHALSALLSRLMFRKHGLVPGNDVEAICARVDWYLHESDLDSAARELNQLTGWPKKLAKDWIESARKHLEVQQALEVVETQASLASLLQS